MATKAQNIASIEKALGEPWADTRARLEAAGGASASHKELADALYPQFDGRVDNHGWWVQGAVVAYEQEIGRRVPGQRADGTFDVAVSRTIPGNRSELIEQFASLVGDTLNEVALDGDPRTSETAKRSFWRANLDGGIKVEADALRPHHIEAAQPRGARGMAGLRQGLPQAALTCARQVSA